jgi:hypothetical protein
MSRNQGVSISVLTTVLLTDNVVKKLKPSPDPIDTNHRVWMLGREITQLRKWVSKWTCRIDIAEYINKS